MWWLRLLKSFPPLWRRLLRSTTRLEFLRPKYGMRMRSTQTFFFPPLYLQMKPSRLYRTLPKSVVWSLLGSWFRDYGRATTCLCDTLEPFCFAPLHVSSGKAGFLRRQAGDLREEEDVMKESQLFLSFFVFACLDLHIALTSRAIPAKALIMIDYAKGSGNSINQCLGNEQPMQI